jgi:uncharacterized membrane protein
MILLVLVVIMFFICTHYKLKIMYSFQTDSNDLNDGVAWEVMELSKHLSGNFMFSRTFGTKFVIINWNQQNTSS